jgi:hypothetical protein
MKIKNILIVYIYILYVMNNVRILLHLLLRVKTVKILNRSMLYLLTPLPPPIAAGYDNSRQQDEYAHHIVPLAP